MLTVNEADTAIHSLVRPGGKETINLEQAAGRVLAQEILANHDDPAFDRVSADGIAIALSDLSRGTRTFRISGLQLPGKPALSRTQAGSAVEVETDALCPQGCELVVPFFDLERETTQAGAGGDRAQLKSSARLEPWSNIQKQGSAAKRGSTIIPPGSFLGSPQLQVIASNGYSRLSVQAKPRWVLVGASELTGAVEEKPKAASIRRANTAALVAEALTWGQSPTGEHWFSADAQTLLQGLCECSDNVDALVLVGAASQGSQDIPPATLEKLGVRIACTGVEQSPGRSFWFGAFPDGRAVFGLPGNPFASLYTFRRYVLPFLLASEGRKVIVPSSLVAKLPAIRRDTTQFIPLSALPNGHLCAQDPTRAANFLQLVQTVGFAEIGSSVDITRPVPWYPWASAGSSA